MQASALQYARRELPRFVSDLREFVRIPSVSSEARHATDVARCARWLADHLRRLGLPCAEVVRTPRHPLVYAEAPGAPGRPTLLVYGHYDVQPPGPIARWRFPPFAARLHEGQVIGRGASDNKGPLLCHIKAAESFLRTSGRPPLTVKFLFEGAEEIGSLHLRDFLTRHRKLLACDTVIVSDTRMRSPTEPAIVYSLRGNLAAEIVVQGPRRELHAGSFGGAIHNPAQVLCELVARLHDSSGRVAVPGFYDGVPNPCPSERAYLSRHAPSTPKLLAQAGVTDGWGEAGFAAFERTTLRPAVVVAGLSAGHGGSGQRSIIPRTARAQLNVRLVGRQDPDQVERALCAFLMRHAPPTVRLGWRRRSAARPVRLPRRHVATRAARQACRRVYGVPPVFLPSGGSIEAVADLFEVLCAPVVLLGFASPNDNWHAPNERFAVRHFRQGIETAIHFFSALAKQPRGLPVRPRRRRHHASSGGGRRGLGIEADISRIFT